MPGEERIDVGREGFSGEWKKREVEMTGRGSPFVSLARKWDG
jgi:hypothetical protein